MFGFTKAKAIVGLDIGSSAVKAVELKTAGKDYSVAAFGSEPIPPDSIVDGAIIDGTAVADAIRRLFERHRFTTKDVAASLSGHAVIVKKINLPVMTDAELAEPIVWEAEQYIPFDIQDVNLDYQILESGHRRRLERHDGSPAGRGQERQDCRLHRRHRSGGPRANHRRRRCVRAAKRLRAQLRRPARRRDRVAQRRRERDQRQHPERYQSLFTRDISIGGNAYTEAVQKELNLPFESAEEIKKGRPVDGMTFDDAAPVLHAMTENVLLEIQKTFDFFKATASSDRIDRVLLSGGASRVDRFAESLHDRFGAPVEAFDPFKKVTFDSSKLGVGDVASVVPTAAVAVGLALRRAGDR